ncbi:formimidoylglutamase [Pseudarthrobacter psychrotolerans]|uniref:Formimidoylglutamase n=1 Tax=Pseudarthrobacter psychrotolerans TaxID=2697569 RepID=A0A6P1NQA9_9MICC|nr:formimidoylglutamase [Pseudarthrobacter psychrotolerans]QHK21368.1 formimidoylglutamase [Pseudarthrobacter psychrotolerans]
MVSPELTVDVSPQPWTGRFDGDGAEHRRWWQAVSPYAPGADSADIPQKASPANSAEVPAVILGFASDEGVRRNKGRTGAALAPAAIRSALGPLAFHLDRTVSDAGDIVVSDGALEAGQVRAGHAMTAMLDAGHLTVVLGGGHETAFASYLGVAGSDAVRGGKRLGILNLDAHFDLRDEPLPSSGTPFLQMAGAEAAAGRAFRYAVVGISEPNNTRSLFNTADGLGVRYLLDEDCTAERVRAFVADFLAAVDVLYLTIDLDVLPASVAPGVSAPAAYGVPLPVVSAVCRQVAESGKLLHLDVAELNPEFDVDGRTAKVAARLVNTLLR